MTPNSACVSREAPFLENAARTEKPMPAATSMRKLAMNSRFALDGWTLVVLLMEEGLAG